MSNFLDYFDLFGQRQDKSGIGKPRNFSYKTELCDDEIVNYVEFKRVVNVSGQPRVAKRVRVYEAYWSPQAQARFGFVYFLIWLSLRFLNPVRIGLSRWRKFPALRLFALHRLAGQEIPFADAIRLERKFRDFENWESRQSYAKGTFSDFLRFLFSSVGAESENSLIISAHKWRKYFILYNAKILLITFLFSSFVCVFVFLFSLSVISLFSFSELMPVKLPSAVSWLTIFAALLSLPLVFRFKPYVQDIFVWTMEAEKDERYANRNLVLGFAQRLIRHVVQDQGCKECIFICHSLGTSIAIEALLKEGQRAALLDREKGNADKLVSGLSKITNIFFLGSPIDRIFYTFQADRTFSHRYNRLYEEQRLSINQPPFWLGAAAGSAKIINVWSRFDPISSMIFSLRKSLGERSDALVQFEALPSGVPYPIATHTTYFSDPNVMRQIYWAVMKGEIPERDLSYQGQWGSHSRLFFWFFPASLLSASIGSLYLWSLNYLSPSSTGLICGVSLLAGLWVCYRSRVLKRSYENRTGGYLSERPIE